MDINSRMVMKPGKQLTADALNDMIEVFHRRQAAALNVVSAGHIGIMTGHRNSVRGVFVRDTFEVEIDDLVAVTPAGEMLNINETAVVKVPLLYGDRYYLTANITDEMVSFESEDMPFVRFAYAFSISTYEEMVENNRFPLVRFAVKDGVFSVDDKFILPSLTANDDPKLMDAIAMLTESIDRLASHHNMTKNDIRQSLLGYIFRLKSIDKYRENYQISSLLAQIQNAVHYMIYNVGVADDEEVPAHSLFDIGLWIEWLNGYVKKATEIMDGVVIEEETIDLESIKQELRAEIYDHIKPDLEQMVSNNVNNLADALREKIESALQDYVDGTVMNTLHEKLRTELDEDIRATLYADLYNALYSVLFTSKSEDEDTFVPLI